jgi:hypothetical protein
MAPHYYIIHCPHDARQLMNVYLAVVGCDDRKQQKEETKLKGKPAAKKKETFEGQEVKHVYDMPITSLYSHHLLTSIQSLLARLVSQWCFLCYDLP